MGAKVKKFAVIYTAASAEIASVLIRQDQRSISIYAAPLSEGGSAVELLNSLSVSIRSE